MNRWRVGLAVSASVVLGAAIVFAGRTGDTQTSPDEQFAESVCAIAIPHADQMIDIYVDAVHTRATPGEDGWFFMYSLAYHARQVAETYRREIRVLSVPDTPAGRKVEKYLDFHSRQPLSHMSEAVRLIRKSPRDMTLIQNIKGLNRLQDDLVFAIGSMGPGFLPVPNVVPELADEFERAESCKKLGARLARDWT